MPSIRGLPLSPSRSDKSTFLRARVYGQNICPVWKIVPTQITSKCRKAVTHFSRRYPWVEGVFKHRRIQNFIHDTSFTIRHNGKKHVYFVFCQNHRLLPINTAVAGAWRGEIVVMKAGTEVEGVINMRTEDALLVDQAINKFVFRVRQRLPFRFPKNLVFDI